MKLRYLLKLISAGSISIVVPNIFEAQLLKHRIGANTRVEIIPAGQWTVGQRTRNIVVEFPGDIPTPILTKIEGAASNVIYSEEIL